MKAVLGQSFGMISVITLAMAGLVCVGSPDFYPLVLGGNRWGLYPGPLAGDLGGLFPVRRFYGGLFFKPSVG